ADLPRERHRRVELLSLEQCGGQRILRRDGERQLPPRVRAVVRATDVAFWLMDDGGEVPVGFGEHLRGVAFAHLTEEQALALARVAAQSVQACRAAFGLNELVEDLVDGLCRVRIASENVGRI